MSCRNAEVQISRGPQLIILIFIAFVLDEVTIGKQIGESVEQGATLRQK